MARDEERGRTSEIIDANLKKIFQQDVERDLPDRFTDLIARLREQDATAAKKTGKED